MTSPSRAGDGYTPEQRLFLSWGAIWQTKIRTEMLLQRLATDPHSPAEFRCNQIVRNVDAFYAAFELTPRPTRSGSTRTSGSGSGDHRLVGGPVR